MKKIKNIENVEKILEENNKKIDDEWFFYNFWCKVNINEVGKCWNWTAGVNEWGYGRYSGLGTNLYSHRVAYMLTKGHILDGLQVQHICNNPKCCNPYHLELGTCSKNSRYMVKCNRQKHSITPNKEIRIFCNENSHLKQWEIAEKFKVHQGTISRIMDGWNC